ncbi:TrkH family potassium uptake protein [Roseovarius sp. Pro17]|uniref:TrkH family potassium uptake protein n=1 Tax=Roseovarius sp. Pro17 TaxID=3108175 RepID=UPI002D772FBF|nr:potassium transporter TrkG [Roseovarius sp. Pro17]
MPRSHVRALSRTRWRLAPPATLGLIYLIFIALGGFVLWLPISNTGDLTLWDALFTSTSAVTVTGLIVADTGSAFTPFGQVVIALLIQLGGLGLMVFAVLVLTVLGIPIGLPYRAVLREEVNQKTLHNLTDIARVILSVSILCEVIGAAILCFVFVPEFGWTKGIGHAMFHSVSAFNNAGFALYSDSLMSWVANPIINMVIPALFILGGLGFIVLADIYQVRSWRKLTLHSKLMIVGTLGLIGFSWFAFAALEWRNPGTLGGLPDTASRIWGSWFQAVTVRTAGFNTLDFAQFHDSTALMIMSLMLVGGGSTSTAGGIKVTTLIVLVIATIAFFRRQTQMHVFGRSLGPEEVLKVLALTMVSMLLVLTGIFVTSISHDGDFLDLAFEITSAFGTVGVSRGATGELDGIGRAVIMLIMFLGRVGPLTLGFFLATRSVPRVRYPKGQIYLG